MNPNSIELLGVNQKELRHRRQYTESVISRLNLIYPELTAWLGAPLDQDKFLDLILEINLEDMPMTLIQMYADQHSIELPKNVDIIKSVKLEIISISYPGKLIELITPLKSMFKHEAEIAVISDCGCFDPASGQYLMNKELQGYLYEECETQISNPAQIAVINCLERIVNELNSLNYATGGLLGSATWQTVHSLLRPAIELPNRNEDREFRISPGIFHNRSWQHITSLIIEEGGIEHLQQQNQDPVAVEPAANTNE